MSGANVRAKILFSIVLRGGPARHSVVGCMGSQSPNKFRHGSWDLLAVVLDCPRLRVRIPLVAILNRLIAWSRGWRFVCRAPGGAWRLGERNDGREQRDG